MEPRPVSSEYWVVVVVAMLFSSMDCRVSRSVEMGKRATLLAVSLNWTDSGFDSAPFLPLIAFRSTNAKESFSQTISLLVVVNE